MTTNGSVTEQLSADPVSPPPSRRRPRRAWFVAAVVVVLVVGLVLGYSLWWTKPTTFTGVGNGFGQKQTVDSMHPITFDMVQRSAHAEAETITLHGVTPLVVTNTARALITFAICARGDDIFMSAGGPASRSCETITDVEGQEIRLSGDAAMTITMTVEPQRRGRVVIEGMEVDYSRGAGHLWQRGSQATGPVVEIQVKN